MYPDNAIVALLWERNEKGIHLLHKKYGQDLTHISYRILNNMSDAEECVNETYLRTWNSIPKARPNSLLAYTGKIIRNLSIDQLKKKTSKKREYDNFSLLLSELEDCIISDDNVETEVEYKELSHAISVFLKEQNREYRYYFIERYWYAKSVKEIAEKYHATEKKVESVLYRCRKKLRLFLAERGYSL